MLYLVATPIGNLSDFSFRAIESLKNCDYVLCEDTRQSQILLNYYQIKTPLRSYHQFNEASIESKIIHDLTSGKNLALMTDAGTPGISDPGERLIKKCIDLHISFTSIPGPCALIQALICSGFDIIPFQFLGFLPEKLNEKREFIFKLMDYQGTTVIYESPHRLIDLLEFLAQVMATRKIAIVRELTKKFETFYYGSVQTIYDRLKDEKLKGEFVIVLEKNQMTLPVWENLSISEHINLMMKDYHLTKKEAILYVSKLREMPKKEIYKHSYLIAD